MKKIRVLTALLIAVGLMCPMAASADTLEIPEEEAVVIDIADLSADDDIAADSYTITDEGALVLEVEHVEAFGVTTALGDAAANGYYTADFMLPDTQKEVFLTGLTQNNVDEIEQAIIAAYTDGENFELTDLGFIDTEKTRDEDDDDEMCWAASASDILMYTGWGAKVGFTDADSIFESFIAAYDNKGSHPYCAFAWFFNGIDNFYSSDTDAAKPIDYPNSGGFLKEYDFDLLIDDLKDLDLSGAEGLKGLCSHLRDGCGVSLSFDLYDEDGYYGAHSTTCWGYVADLSYSPDEKEYYTDILITDSDSDELLGVDRREAKDVMSCYALESIIQDPIDAYLINFSNEEYGIINECVALQPYSAAVPFERDPNATLDRINYPDMTFSGLYLTSQSGKKEYKIKFPVGSTIYYSPIYHNLSDSAYSGPFTVNISATDNRGKEVYSRTVNGTWTFDPHFRFTLGFYSINSLSAGDYTISFEINPSHTVREAYYYNNVISYDFKIRDTYICGDYDGDSRITPADATLIQRVDIGIETGFDDTALIRGDADSSGGTNILDATFVQRYATGLFIPVDVGSTMMYD